VALRKDLLDQGLDAGAHTIAFHLAAGRADVPSVSTIWRLLSRRGFVVPQPQKRPKSSFIRFEAEMPNERWQADITHWHLADGTDIEVLNIIETTPDSSWDRMRSRSSRWPTWWRASTKPLRPTGSRPRCSPTTVRCSPRHLGEGVVPWSWNATGWGSKTSTPGLITRRPAARSNASTRP